MASHQKNPTKKKVSGYFIQLKKHNGLCRFLSINNEKNGECCEDSSICLPDPDMKIVASCNPGILCCAKKKENKLQYYVGKLTTQQWKQIPNPTIRDVYDESSMGITVLQYSDDPLRFAIVRLVSGGEGPIHEYQCEIFDSKFWTWREYANLVMPTFFEFIEQNPAVSVRSAFHWLTSANNVVALYIKDGETNFEFEHFRLPNLEKNIKYAKLVDYEGKLGVIGLNEEGKMELWQMFSRDYSQKKLKCWFEKTTKITLKKHKDQEMYPCVEGFYNVDMLGALKKFRGIILYKKLEDVFVRMDQLNEAGDVFLIRSDSEPILFYKFSSIIPWLTDNVAVILVVSLIVVCFSFFMLKWINV